LQIHRATLPPEHPDIARTLAHLGDTLLALKRYEESEGTLRQALVAGRKAFSSDDPDLAFTLEAYSQVLEHQNKTAEAKSLGDEATRIRTFLSAAPSARSVK